MEFCRICLEQVSKNLIFSISCGCQACLDCHKNWAISQISSEKTYIKCPFPECGLMLNSLDQFLPLEVLEKLQENQLSMYLKYNKSIHKCPKPGCNYSGFGTKSTQEDFYCEKCAECWVEPSENFKLKLFEMRKYEEEGLNILWKALFCKLCPGCEIFIEKNEGCRHIDCIMCGTDFCWFCKQSYKTHQQVQCSNNLSRCVFIWIVIFTIMVTCLKLVYCSVWAYLVFYYVCCMPFVFLYILLVKIFCFVILYNLGRLFFNLVLWILHLIYLDCVINLLYQGSVKVVITLFGLWWVWVGVGVGVIISGIAIVKRYKSLKP